MFILVPALIMTALPLVNSRELREHKWFCEAEGMNSQRQYQRVSGPTKPTQRAAESAALETCYGMALMGCSVRTCIDESMPAPLLH